MALSDWDKKHLDLNQQRAVQTYTAEWEKAKRAGNTERMRWAHNGAETIRRQAGYSGGKEGSTFLPAQDTAKTTNTGTAGKANQQKGYDNGSLTTQQVKQLQKALGVDQDGYFGPKTQAAAFQRWGASNADAAMKSYTSTSTPARTSFSFDEDEGIYHWNGQTFTTKAALTSAMNSANLSAAEKNIVGRKTENSGSGVKLQNGRFSSTTPQNKAAATNNSGAANNAAKSGSGTFNLEEEGFGYMTRPTSATAPKVTLPGTSAYSSSAGSFDEALPLATPDLDFEGRSAADIQKDLAEANSSLLSAKDAAKRVTRKPKGDNSRYDAAQARVREAQYRVDALERELETANAGTRQQLDTVTQQLKETRAALGKVAGRSGYDAHREFDRLTQQERELESQRRALTSELTQNGGKLTAQEKLANFGTGVTDLVDSVLSGGDSAWGGVYGALAMADEATGNAANAIKRAVTGDKSESEPFISPFRETAQYHNEKAADTLQRASEGRSNLGRRVMSTGQAAGNMLAMSSLGALTGGTGAGMGATFATSEAGLGTGAAQQAATKLVNLGARIGNEILSHSTNALISAGSAGHTYLNAMDSGADQGKAMANAIGSGLVEYFSNKMFSGTPLEDTGEKGYVTRLIEYAADRLGKSEALGTFLNSALGKGAGVVFDKLGEGFEEVITAIGDPLLERLTWNPEADMATVNEIVDSFAGGLALSIFMSGGEAVIDNAARLGDSVRGVFSNGAAPQGSGVDSGAGETLTGAPAAGNLTPATNRDAEARISPQSSQTQNAAPGMETTRLPRMSMSDFANTESPVWNNVDYGDTDTQQQLMQTKHQEMVDAGEVVKAPERALNEVAQAYPDLRGMKKSERTPILKQKMGELKNALRNLLNGLKGAYEFEVNGNILEARLYDTGVREVMQNITQPKAAMLTQSGDIFRNAQYLYSTPDYEGNPNIYRWNYFYTPVQIGNQTVGVRIAVRDMVPSADGRMDSQIYHWGIKEDAPLGGGRPGTNPNTTDASSDAPTVDALGGGSRGPKVASPDASSAATIDENTITQPSIAVKPSLPTQGNSQMIGNLGAVPSAERVAQVQQMRETLEKETEPLRRQWLETEYTLHEDFLQSLKPGDVLLDGDGVDFARVTDKDALGLTLKGTEGSDFPAAETILFPQRGADGSILPGTFLDGEPGQQWRGHSVLDYLEPGSSNGVRGGVTVERSGGADAELAGQGDLLADTYADADTLGEETGGVSLAAPDLETGTNDSLGSARSGFDPFSAAENKYGTMDGGMKAVRPDDVPVSTNGKDHVSRSVVSMKGAAVTPDAFVPLIENETMKGRFSYIPITNDATTARAQSYILRHGWEEALRNWTADVRAHRSGPESTAIGALLYNNAVNSGNSQLALDILADFQDYATNTAQALQAMRILKTLTPQDRLYMIERQLSKYNEQAAEEKRQRNKKRNVTDADNVPVEEWMKRVGEDLAEQLANQGNVKKARAKTLAETIFSDLKQFYADDGKPGAPAKAEQAREARTEFDRIYDLFQNQEYYQEAWDAAREKLKASLGDDPETLTAYDEWIRQAPDYTKRLARMLTGEETLSISKELADRYLNAETEAERDAVIEEMRKEIAKQLPSTLLDKWNALRYLNMLGNFKTQIRNVAGNVGMQAMTRAKDAVAAGIENLAYAVSGGKFERTKAFLPGKDLRRAARADFSEVEKMALGESRYDLNEGKRAGASDIVRDAMEQRTIFKRADGRQGPIYRTLEAYRNATNWAMEQGDVIFSRASYTNALAGWLKAHNITAEQFTNEEWRAANSDVVDAARAYAILEAQEATFRDTNTVSRLMSSAARGKDVPSWARVLGEGLMPFRKTPANVAVRAVEYSPLGLINTAVKTVQVASGTGDVTGADVINQLSKTLTGSGLFGLGLWLAFNGLLRGGDDEDQNQEYFDDLNGHQNYALELPNGTSYTLDWVTPGAIPLFMGVAFADGLRDGGFQISDIEGALSQIAEPMLQMSMLSSINDTLDSLKYSKDNIGQLLGTLAISYATQGLTNTLLGQIERTAETERMSTYVEHDSAVPSWLQRQLGKMSAKTPGWDYHQYPYIDAWGRTESSGDVGTRAFTNFTSPGYLSKVSEGVVENELQRLADSLGDTNLFPDNADKSFSVNGTTRYLTREEYVEYAAAKGSKSFELISDLIGDDGYNDLNDEERAKAIKDLYAYANAKAKQETLGIPLNATAAKIEDVVQAGIDPTEYLIYNAKFASLTPEEGKKDVSDMQKFRVIAGENMSDQDKIAAIGTIMGTDMTTESGGKSQYAKMLDLIDSGLSLDQYLDLKAADAVDTYMNYQASQRNRDYGIAPDDFISFKSGKEKYDADGNGSYTQKEVRAAIDGIFGSSLTNEQKAVLWQMQGKNWAPKNNPYSRTVGQDIYDGWRNEDEPKGLPSVEQPKVTMPKLTLPPLGMEEPRYLPAP